MKRLSSYFSDGITSKTLQTIGMEIETQFVDKYGRAIEIRTSQLMLKYLSKNGWKIKDHKKNLITTLVDKDGNLIFYELGRHNMEVSTIASTTDLIISIGQKCLNQIYESGRKYGAFPYFKPILDSDEDLLVIPDERDAIWLELDGKEALMLLARTSSVQFTISVSPEDVIPILNKLGNNLNLFMVDYPQDEFWKKYIKTSPAGYLFDRYGGPLLFKSLNDYCEALAKHDVVQGTNLVEFSQVNNLNIPLFLRSIWWYFRLKRYGNALCIEIRPMPRRSDGIFQQQLDMVLKIIQS